VDKTVDPIVWKLLCETAPSRVADAAVRLAGDEVAAIEASLPGALEGNREHVHLYVIAYRRLSERMLEVVDGACPDLLSCSEKDWRLMVIHHQMKKPAPECHRAISSAKAVLWGEAMNAPFTYWVGSLDSGRGTAVAMVSLLRQTLPGGRALSPPSKRLLPSWELDDRDVVRFYRAVTEVLWGAEQPLERVREILALNRTGAAELFGVRRQALEGWERNGVPAERQAKLATIGAIADILSVALKADRVAAVVRRAAPAYGDRSILEAIAAGDEEQVLEALRSGFDWASAA
jgi:DNA-binding XRE family transcriptional regulator